MSNLFRCVLLGAVAALALGGCGSKDCTREDDATARDWCYYEVTVDAAKGGKVDQALGAIGSISDPMVKASAIDKLFLNAPTPLDQGTAQNLGASGWRLRRSPRRSSSGIGTPSC